MIVDSAGYRAGSIQTNTNYISCTYKTSKNHSVWLGDELYNTTVSDWIGIKKKTLGNSLHALKTHFTQCEYLKPCLQLSACPQNIFQPVPTPQTPFSTIPLPLKHISPGANTSNPLLNC